MSLATLSVLKSRLGIGDANDDVALSAVLTGVTGQIEAEANRRFEQATVTEYKDVDEADVETLFLDRWPVASITSVTEALYHDHASATALTEGASGDFFCTSATGELHRIGCDWLEGRDTVKVVYVGGYAAADIPAELAEAAIQQAAFTWQRRKELGLSGVSNAGGNVSAYARDELLPGVKAICDQYRRRLG